MPIERRLDAEGATPVVVHLASAEDAPLLRATADRLRRAAHPGVVRILDSGETSDGGWILRTAHGGGPLSVTCGLGAARLADIGRSVATTLADLHDAGICHGRLSPDRILLGPDGDVRLCGFGSSEDGGPDDDVAALGRILLDALAGAAEGETGRSGRAGATAAALRAAATTAADPDPVRRPLMRRLAGSLEALADRPAARSGDVALRRPDRGRRRAAVDDTAPAITRPGASAGKRQAWPLVVVAGLIVAVGAALLQVHPRLGSDPAAAPPTAAAPLGTTATTTPASSSSSTTVDDELTPCVAITDRPSHGSADSCPHRTSIDGSVVTVDGRRYEVGLPGDQIAVGSFRCSSDVVIAVLRPSSGDVFVFGAPGDDAQDVGPTVRMPGAVAFRAIGVSDRCQQLRVVDDRGATSVVPMGSVA